MSPCPKSRLLQKAPISFFLEEEKELVTMEDVNKKNESRLCWNCDGSIGFQFENCPYCGVHLNASPVTNSVAKEPLKESQKNTSHQEWNDANMAKKGEDKKELFSLLLLLPGVVFFLFSVVLFFFSTNGTLSLKWNQSFAYFYFLGSIPLLYLGYKSLK